MQKAGVNVFPAVDAEKYVSINSKVHLCLIIRAWLTHIMIASAFRKSLAILLTLMCSFSRYQEEWLEGSIYKEMALTASAFAYTWSKWNADCGKDKIILQAIEQLQDEQPLEVNNLMPRSWDTTLKIPKIERSLNGCLRASPPFRVASHARTRLLSRATRAWLLTMDCSVDF